MTPIKDLKAKARSWNHTNGHPAFAIDYKPSPRAKTRRIVLFAPTSTVALFDFNKVIAKDYQGKAKILSVVQLNGPIRVYSLAQGVTA